MNSITSYSCGICSLLMLADFVCVDLILLKVCFRWLFTMLLDFGRYFCTSSAVNTCHVAKKLFLVVLINIFLARL